MSENCSFSTLLLELENLFLSDPFLYQKRGIVKIRVITFTQKMKQLPAGNTNEIIAILAQKIAAKNQESIPAFLTEIKEES